MPSKSDINKLKSAITHVESQVARISYSNIPKIRLLEEKILNADQKKEIKIKLQELTNSIPNLRKNLSKLSSIINSKINKKELIELKSNFHKVDMQTLEFNHYLKNVQKTRQNQKNIQFFTKELLQLHEERLKRADAFVEEKFKQALIDQSSSKELKKRIKEGWKIDSVTLSASGTAGFNAVVKGSATAGIAVQLKAPNTNQVWTGDINIPSDLYRFQQSDLVYSYVKWENELLSVSAELGQSLTIINTLIDKLIYGRKETSV